MKKTWGRPSPRNLKHWKENYRKDNIKDVSYFNTGFVEEVFRTILVVSISDQQCLSNNINLSTILKLEH